MHKDRGEVKSKMPRNLNSNDLAILVIDMQEGYLNCIPERNRLIAAQQNVLRYAAREDVPVAVLTMAYEKPTEEVIKKEIKKVPRQVYIRKECMSGFEATTLEQQLHMLERNTLLLMGIYASQCVKATASDGLKKGFNIITHTEIIGDFSNKNMKQALQWYKRNGCLIRGYRNLFNP